MKQKHEWINDKDSKIQTCKKCGWNRRWINHRWQIREYYRDNQKTWLEPKCEIKEKKSRLIKSLAQAIIFAIVYFGFWVLVGSL